LVIKDILAFYQGYANNIQRLSESGGDSVKTILCNDCGEIMTRFMNKCHACSRTNLSYYASPDSKELQAKVKQLRGGVDGWTRVMYASLLVGVFAVMIFGYSQQAHVKKVASEKPVQTAATTSTIAQ